MFVLCDIVGTDRLVVDKSSETLGRFSMNDHNHGVPQAILWVDGEVPKHGEALTVWKYDGEVKVVESERELGLPRYEEGEMEETNENGWTDWMSQGDLGDVLGTRASTIWKAVNEGPGTYRDWQLETRPVDEALDGHRDLHPQTSTLYRARLACYSDGSDGDDVDEQTGEAAASSSASSSADEDAELTAQLSLIQHSAIQYVDVELRNRSDLPQMIVDALDEIEHVIEQQDEQIEDIKAKYLEHREALERVAGALGFEGYGDIEALVSWAQTCHSAYQEASDDVERIGPSVDQEMIDILWSYLEGDRPDRSQVGAVLRAYYGEVAA